MRKLPPRHCVPLVTSACFAFGLLVASGTSGCSSDSADPSAKPAGPEPDSIEAEPFASTRKLEDADLALLTTSDDDGTLTFASEPPGLQNAEVGQVLLAGMSAKVPAGL